jgi:hypothetical protein
MGNILFRTRLLATLTAVLGMLVTITEVPSSMQWLILERLLGITAISTANAALAIVALTVWRIYTKRYAVLTTIYVFFNAVLLLIYLAVSIHLILVVLLGMHSVLVVFHTIWTVKLFSNTAYAVSKDTSGSRDYLNW